MPFCLNGVVSREAPLISCEDRGFLYGDSLFETIPYFEGCLPFFDEHMQRLLHSLRCLQFPDFDYQGVIEKSLGQLLPCLPSTASLRITITRGSSTSGLPFSPQAKPTVLLAAKPLVHGTLFKPREEYQVCLSSRPHIDPGSFPTGHKHGNYLASLLAISEAHLLGCDEALWVDSADRLVEGAKTNVFWVAKKNLFTPPLSLGPLNGITRRVVLELASQIGIAVRESEMSLAGLGEVDEVFLTNSVLGIQPVTSIARNQMALFHAPAGPVTAHLMAAFLAKVDRCPKWQPRTDP